ncbi:MAG TPA: SGNH/GDSL hydrolase family protein [Gemmatimonadaceae bacterium]|nr:SGNH/GDSL hydrolase family protein [Gemmatimonadaceae bacterium]
MTHSTAARARRTSLLLALSISAAATLGAQRTYSSLTMFGDSFSDVGNAQQLAPGLGVPARFSNGPIWSDRLGSLLGRSVDVTPAVLTNAPRGVYAIGSATTSFTGAGTGAQVALWCQAVSGTCTRGADATGLYTLFAGANDLRAAAALGTDFERRTATVTAAQNLLLQGQGLTSAGARALLFAYLPDMGLTPDRRNTAASPILSDLTRLFNTTLETGINQLRLGAPSATFFDLRLDNLFANLLANPAANGFGNVTTPCIAAGALPGCAGFAFWDGLHPTSAAHMAVGDAAYNLVAFNRNVALVPEPSTILLLAGGLLLLYFFVRMKIAPAP